MDEAHLLSCSRRELQALAKQHGVKANQKTALIIQQLVALAPACPQEAASPPPAAPTPAALASPLLSGSPEAAGQAAPAPVVAAASPPAPSPEAAASPEILAAVPTPEAAASPAATAPAVVEPAPQPGLPPAPPQPAPTSAVRHVPPPSLPKPGKEGRPTKKRALGDIANLPSKVPRLTKKKAVPDFDAAHKKLFNKQASILEAKQNKARHVKGLLSSKASTPIARPLPASTTSAPVAGKMVHKKRATPGSHQAPKRPVFDLKASLKKKPTWQLKTGPIPL